MDGGLRVGDVRQFSPTSCFGHPDASEKLKEENQKLHVQFLEQQQQLEELNDRLKLSSTVRFRYDDDGHDQGNCDDGEGDNANGYNDGDDQDDDEDGCSDDDYDYNVDGDDDGVDCAMMMVMTTVMMMMLMMSCSI